MTVFKTSLKAFSGEVFYTDHSFTEIQILIETHDRGYLNVISIDNAGKEYKSALNIQRIESINEMAEA